MTTIETKPITPAQQAQRDARQLYRDSLKAESPLTGVELGKAFERSERWGRDRIAEVKAEASSPVLSPAVPETGTGPTPPTAEALRPASSLPPAAAETAGPVPSAEAEGNARRKWWHRKRQAAPAASAATERPVLTPKAAAPKRHVPQAETTSKAAATAPGSKASGKPRGRLIAWTTMAVGIVVSMGANVGHIVFVIGPTMPGGPSPWSMGLAAFWPLSLFLAIEVITKVSWPSSLAYNLARFGAVGAIAVVAAWVSYWHMHGLLSHWGEDALSAYVGPFGVDGLVVIGGIALAAIRRTKADTE